MKGTGPPHDRERRNKQACELHHLLDTLNHDAQTATMRNLYHAVPHGQKSIVQSHLDKAAGCICSVGESNGRVVAALHVFEREEAASFPLRPLDVRM